jgi:hypothetical protein
MNEIDNQPTSITGSSKNKIIKDYSFSRNISFNNNILELFDRMVHQTVKKIPNTATRLNRAERNKDNILQASLNLLLKFINKHFPSINRFIT